MTQEATQAGEYRAPRSQDAGRNAKPESQGPENLPPLSFLPPAHKREPAAAPPALPRPRETPNRRAPSPPRAAGQGLTPPIPHPRPAPQPTSARYSRRRSQSARGRLGATARGLSPCPHPHCAESACRDLYTLNGSPGAVEGHTS